MGRDGYLPVFNPKINVAHINPESLTRLVLHEVEHGWAFGELRIQEENFSDVKRLIYGLGAPLLPAMLLMRILRRVLSNRMLVSKFLFTLPIVWVGLTAWSLGEMFAYLSPIRKRSTEVKVGVIEPV